MNNRLAIILSVLFHPLILTTYLFALLCLWFPDLIGLSAFEWPALISLLTLLFLNTFVAPAVVTYYFMKMGVITNLYVDDVSERRLPYLVTAIIYGLATYLFGWQLQPVGQMAPQISFILASVTVSLVIITCVSFFWKISAHATGIGGVVAMLAGLLMRSEDYDLLNPLLVTILLAGLLLSARLQLNAHNPAQILVGFLCGVLVSSITVYFYF